MEYSGGWGSKAKVPSVGGKDICTIIKIITIIINKQIMIMIKIY